MTGSRSVFAYARCDCCGRVSRVILGSSERGGSLCAHCGKGLRRRHEKKIGFEIPGSLSTFFRRSILKLPSLDDQDVLYAVVTEIEAVDLGVTFVELRQRLRANFSERTIRDKKIRVFVGRAIADGLIEVRLGEDGIARYVRRR